MRKFVFVLLFGLLSLNVLISQPGGQGFGKQGVIKGSIYESDTHNPLSFVNVMLYRVSNDSLVSGAISDREGNFEINELTQGDYYIQIKLIGYEKKKQNHIKITQKNPVYDLGKIELALSSLLMEGVEVTAEKPLMEYKMDKKVINVSRDIISQGGSAVNVLENSPSVQVDVEGNVSLRGSSNFTVFINNKPSVLAGSDALEQIPAASIETIEIITNPSAKYDPDGIGGIINVVLKKEADSGLNGIFDISAGTGDKYSTNLLLNYKISDFTIFGGVDYSKDRRNFEGNSEKTYKFFNPVNHYDSDMSGGRNHEGYSIKGGLGYNLTQSTFLNLQGSLGKFGFRRDQKNERFQWFENQPELDSFFLNSSIMDRKNNYFNANLDFTHQFNKGGHQITTSAYLSKEEGDGDNLQEDFISDKNWNRLARSNYNVDTYEPQEESEYRFKADYSLPINADSKFEAGYQARLDREVETYDLSFFNAQSNTWIHNDSLSNAMDFANDIHSFYSTFSDKIWDLSFSAGLRAEYTKRVIGVLKENKDYIIDTLDWFPTLHLSQDLGTSQQIMLSYSRRIERPHGWDLEPSVMYMDANSYRVGNPALQPEYIDSYELGYQKYFGMSFVSVESFYRLTKNKITRLSSLVGDKVYYSTVNLDQDYTAGLELSGNYEPAKFLRFNVSSSIYKYQLNGNVSDESVSKSTTVWDANFTGTYLMPTETRLQINCFYSGPTISAQGTVEGSFALNMAIRQDFLNKKASITLQVRDILGTMKREYNSITPELITHDLRDFESPVFTLSFSYKINNYQKPKDEKGMENGGGGSEGEF